MSQVITSAISVCCGCFCIFGCVFCSEYCRKNSANSTMRERSSLYMSRRPLKRNPVIAGADLASKDVECSICLECYEVGQSLAVLNCMHFYHDKCLRRWNIEHLECPQCRENIEIVVID